MYSRDLLLYALTIPCLLYLITLLISRRDKNRQKMTGKVNPSIQGLYKGSPKEDMETKNKTKSPTQVKK